MRTVKRTPTNDHLVDIAFKNACKWRCEGVVLLMDGLYFFTNGAHFLVFSTEKFKLRGKWPALKESLEVVDDSVSIISLNCFTNFYGRRQSKNPLHRTIGLIDQIEVLLEKR